MANFPTHIGIGTLASGMLATLTLAANVVGPESLVAVTAAGVLGSVLPDIDLKDSRPGRALFFGLAAFFAFVALFLGAGKYSIVELWILAAGAFVMVRYVAHGIFHRISYHRGIFHSVLAAVFFALLTVLIYRYVLGRHEGVAWLAGGFMLIGYLVHLLLDEIYSVDVMDTRVKSSFGTALKLWDSKRMGQSAMMAAAAAGLFMLTPPTRTFVDGISSPELWSELKRQLLPQEKWFGMVAARWPGSTGDSAPGTSQPALAADPAEATRAAGPAALPNAAGPAAPIVTGTLPTTTPAAGAPR